MSPSTVIRLKLAATASLSAARRAFAPMAASVVMKQSMVAWSDFAAGRAPVALMPG